MLAAHFRRASRMFLGLAVVTALSAGLSLVPPGVEVSSARAVENAAEGVQVSIFPTSGSGITEGNDLSVTVALTNNSSEGSPAGEIVVTTGSAVLGDATSLENWLAKSDGEQQPGRWLGVISAPGLAAGATLELTATFPLTNAFYGGDWGPRGLAADLDIAGDSAGSGRGVLLWEGSGSTPTANLVTLLPVVAPASTSGLLTADELTLLTAPQGVLTEQLGLATGRDVSLAIDPRIVASISALGSDAPLTATLWLERLLALPNESFALAYADADVALQAQAGFTSLTVAGFADQPALVPTATPSPSGTPSATPVSDPVIAPGTDGILLPNGEWWAPSVAGIAWPAENTVVTSDLAVLSTNATRFSILSSSNVASGLESPAHTAISDQQILITNAGLNRAIDLANSAETDVEWGENLALATAYLATTALAGGEFPAAIVGLSRESLGDVSVVRTAETLNRLAGLSWVEGSTLSAVTATSPAAETTVVDKPESEERVLLAQRILERHGALAGFSTILTTPALLTDATTRQELALLSVAWRSSEGWPGAVNGYLQETFTTLDSIHIVPSSEIQMVGGQVNIPVTIENVLSLPATVLVRATPSNARLTVDADATLLVQGGSQAKALVPVKARVGNGSVLLSVSLYSPSGVPIGTPESLPVNVRADWETWGLGVLGVLFAGLLITGVVRTLRKRRNEGMNDLTGQAATKAETTQHD